MRLPVGKVIITAALNGAIARKKDNPNVPEHPEEIARAAAECYEAGAAIVHIHARDEQGTPCGTREKFARIMAAVCERCSEIIIQLSTGGGSNLTIEEGCRASRPARDGVSQHGTLMRQTGPQAGVPFSNLTKDIEGWAAEIKDLGIKPEMECYSQSMYRDVRNLIDKALIDPPYYVNIVLGMVYRGAVEATPETLVSMHRFLPDGCYFNTTATRAAQLPLTTMGMVMGGAIRVGLEDNIYLSRGVPAESNAQLVARSVRIARELNIEPATPDEAREILGVAKR